MIFDYLEINSRKSNCSAHQHEGSQFKLNMLHYFQFSRFYMVKETLTMKSLSDLTKKPMTIDLR